VSRNHVRNICCIGAGYVGGPTMAVFADECPDLNVTVLDINPEKISLWNSNDLSELPIFEPGLDKVILRCRNINLFFSTDIEANIANADMIFISVNTPTKTRGIGAGKALDLKWVESCARQIAKFATGHTIVVEKSTLPVRTAEVMKTILNSSNDHSKSKTFSVLSNPEFLAEGCAINDLKNPDRVLIGGEDELAINELANIYLNWVPSSKILRTNIWSSELSKLTANAFLAQRISSINSISALCEKCGANIEEVVDAIGSDTRIGNQFLNSGPGFGGSCFQKDILNLIYIASNYGLDDVANYWQEVLNLNNWQKERISKLIVQNLFGTVTGKRIAILGFAFKANTNDTRESPAIQVCENLLEEGANLAIYDPKVSQESIELALGVKETSVDEFSELSSWVKCNSDVEACIGADAIVVLTNWEQFTNISLNKLYEKMRKPAWLFDTRACIDIDTAKKIGFNTWRIGI